METPRVLVVKGQDFSGHLKGMLHLENPNRVDAFESVMDNPSLEGRWLELSPRQADTEELTWIHTSEYVEMVSRSSGRPFTSFDFETQATADSYETARLAVGGVFSLIDAVLEGKGKRGFAFVRPPGHHAEPDRAMGFCLFNNTALGAAYLKERYGFSRIMIVDVDAHHGNGIQSAFYDTDEVLYVSFHGFPGFPGTGNLGEVGLGKGEGFTVNIPLEKGQGDEAVARIVHHIAFPLAQAYRPQMILVPFGFDLYQRDRLGGMSVTPGGYGLLTHLLCHMADTVCNGQIIFVLEGGYSIKGIRECGLRVMEQLCGVGSLNLKKLRKIQEASPSRHSAIKKVMEIQRKYWNVFDR